MFRCAYCQLDVAAGVVNQCEHYLMLAIETRAGRFFGLGLIGTKRRYEKGPFDTREQAVREVRRFGKQAALLMGPQHVRYHDELRTDWTD